MFVIECDVGFFHRSPCECRTDTPFFELELVAVTIRIFVHRADPHREVAVYRLSNIHHNALLSEASGINCRISDRVEVSFLRHPVDDAAATAATKNQSAGSFQHFNAINIVDVADIFGVVSDAIDEKVSGRILTTYQDLVAAAFTLLNGYAGRILERLANIEDGAILKLFFCYDIDRLSVCPKKI